MAESKLNKRERTNKSVQPVSSREKNDDIRMRLQFAITFLALRAWPSVIAWTPSISSENPQGGTSRVDLSSLDPPLLSNIEDLSSRRKLIATFASASFAIASIPTSAFAVDSQVSTVGAQAPPPDGSSPFITLDNGVKIKDFKLGSGNDSIGPNSKSVSIQCSGRLLNLNGVIFYNTKNNNPDGFGALPLVIDLGKGQMVPGTCTKKQQ